MPTSSRIASRSLDFAREVAGRRPQTSPAVGSSSPLMQRSTVLLPEPRRADEDDDLAGGHARGRRRRRRRRGRGRSVLHSRSMMTISSPGAGRALGHRGYSSSPSRLPVPAQEQREHERHRQVEERQDQVGRPELERRARVEPRLLGDLADREHRQQRRVLEHRDQVVAERRRHVAHRLREHDPAHRLAVAQPERPTGLGLALRHRLDAGAEHLGEVRAVDERERDDRAPWKIDTLELLNPKRARELRHDHVRDREDAARGSVRRG